MKKALYIIALTLGLAACTHEDIVEQNQDQPSFGQPLTMTVTASIAETKTTKTALTEGYDVVWSDGDQITIGGKTFTLSEGAGTTSGKFTGDQLADGTYDAYYATNDGQVPTAQTYIPGKITNAPMQAKVTVTDGEAGSISFTNIGGLLHLTIKKVKAATVKSIVISEDMSVSSSRLVLDCGNSGVEITEEGTEFYIAMAAGTYSNVKIELNTTDNQVITKKLSSSNNLEITRSQITNASFKTNTLNGHEFVDLGLTSGLFWATCNLGASTPFEVGDYFAWGETKTKDYDLFTWDNYKYGDSANTLTKYCSNDYYGTVDNKTRLEEEDDAACQRWKDGWRMPTADEYQELIDECYWEWTRHYNNQNNNPAGWIVYKVKANEDKGKMCDTNGTGKIDGYSVSDTHIFLIPSGRFKFDNETSKVVLEYPGDCYYWTSTLWHGFPYSAQNLAANDLKRFVNIDEVTKREGHWYRYSGEPIRAVCK